MSWDWRSDEITEAQRHQIEFIEINTNYTFAGEDKGDANDFIDSYNDEAIRNYEQDSEQEPYYY